MLKLKPFSTNYQIHISKKKNNFRVDAITLSMESKLHPLFFFCKPNHIFALYFFSACFLHQHQYHKNKTSVKHSNLVWPVWYLSSRSFWCRGHTPWLEGGQTGRRMRRPALSSVVGRGRAWWSYCEPYDSLPSVWPLRSWWGPWSLV